jgi:hypothetical protein
MSSGDNDELLIEVAPGYQLGTQNVVTWDIQDGYYDVILTPGTGWTQRYAGRVAKTAGKA